MTSALIAPDGEVVLPVPDDVDYLSDDVLYGPPGDPEPVIGRFATVAQFHLSGTGNDHNQQSHAGDGGGSVDGGGDEVVEEGAYRGSAAAETQRVADAARRGVDPADFDGPVMHRGIAITVDDDLKRRADTQIGRPTSATDHDAFNEQLHLGPEIVDQLLAFEGHGGIERTGGIGQSWTTREKVAQSIQAGPGQNLLVKVTARPRQEDIVIQEDDSGRYVDADGKEIPKGREVDLVSGEREVRIHGQSPVDIIDVQVAVGNNKWESVWGELHGYGAGAEELYRQYPHLRGELAVSQFHVEPSTEFASVRGGDSVDVDVDLIELPADVHAAARRRIDSYLAETPSAEFANPWHDDRGRFAPKGTGRRSTGERTLHDAETEILETQIAVSDVYSFGLTDDAGERYFVQVDGAPRTHDGTYIVDGYIENEMGDSVGEFQRWVIPSQGVVMNERFNIEPEFQNKGIGTAFLDLSEEALLNEFGIDKAEITAVDVGKYAWAARGYQLAPGTAPAERTRSQWSDGANKVIQSGTLTASETREAQAVLDHWRRDPSDIYGADLLAVNNGAFRDVFLDGDNWGGVKEITAPFEEQIAASGAQFANPWHDEIGRFAPKGTGSRSSGRTSTMVGRAPEGYQVGLFGNAERDVQVVDPDHADLKKRVDRLTDGVIEELDDYTGYMSRYPHPGQFPDVTASLEEMPPEIIEGIDSIIEATHAAYRVNEPIQGDAAEALRAEAEALKQAVKNATSTTFTESFQVPDSPPTNWTRDGVWNPYEYQPGDPISVVSESGQVTIDVPTDTLTARKTMRLLSDDKIQTIMDGAQRAIDANPVLDGVPISIRFDHGNAALGAFGEDGTTLGYVSAGRYSNEPTWRTVNLHPGYMTQDRQVGETRHPMGSQPFAEGLRWTVMHELGHTAGFERARIDGDPFDDWQSQAVPVINNGNTSLMSGYGKTSSLEAHAEAFAEWSNTAGTTNNPVVQWYANRFGWRAPTSASIEELSAAKTAFAMTGFDAPFSDDEPLTRFVSIDDIDGTIDTTDGPLYPPIDDALVASAATVDEFANRYLDDLTAAMSRSLSTVQDQVIERLRSSATELVTEPETMVAAPGSQPFDLGNFNLLDAADWADAFQVEAADLIGDVVVDAGTGVPLRAGLNVADDVITDLINRHVERLTNLGTQVRGSVARTLEAAVRDRMPLDDVVELMQERGPIGEVNARAIARTELTAAQNGGMFAGWRRDDVPFKQWVSLHDDRVRDPHLEADGQIVPVEQEFEVGGYPAMYPGDPRLPVGLRINCRCYMERVGQDGQAVPGNLADATKKELYSLAQELNIRGRSRMNKDDLFQSIDRWRNGFGEQALESLTRPQLIARARTAGITGRWRMRKPELMVRLRQRAQGRTRAQWLIDAGHAPPSVQRLARNQLEIDVAEALRQSRRGQFTSAPSALDTDVLRQAVFGRYQIDDTGWVPCVGCGARLHWSDRTMHEQMTLMQIDSALPWDARTTIPVCRADAAALATADLPALVASAAEVPYCVNGCGNPAVDAIALSADVDGLVCADCLGEPMSTDEVRLRLQALRRAEFANPWHDEDGKFAPKGTGKKFGPAEEVEQLGSRQRARYDEALASFGGDHTAAMKEALRGRRNLEGMIDATDEQRKALGVPPAWRYVMIAGDTGAGGANGLLVTGIDAAGRTQNRYTEAKTREQAIKKYERTAELVQKLPALDEALGVDAATNPTAAVVELIRKTGMRVGSTDDTRAQKQAYGASTLEARHVTVDGDQTRFEFTGKKGVPIDVTVDDSRLAALMSQYKGDKSGSQRLFDTGPDEANAYLKQHTDSKFKIKDLRTVRANVEARRTIAEMDPPTTKTGFRSARRRVGEAVGAVLGNKASQALKSYINPAVFNDWVFGEEVALVAAGAPTPNEEQAMVEALERLVERAPLAMSEESDVEIDAEDEADPEGLEEEDPEDTDDMDTQFGVQFANPWHDEAGRFAPKGSGRKVPTGEAGMAELGLSPTGQYESDRPVYEHRIEDRLGIITEDGTILLASADSTKSSTQRAWPRSRQRVVNVLNGAAIGYEQFPTATPPEVVFVDEPEAPAPFFVDPHGARYPQHQIAINLHSEFMADQMSEGRSREIFMPGATSVHPEVYTGAHEYGHVRAALGDDDRSILGDVMPRTLGQRSNDPRTHYVFDEMSRYAKTNAAEAHAEAFAEWAVTGGTTTNGFARAYADIFGWDDGQRQGLAASGGPSTGFDWDDIDILGDSPHGPVYKWGRTSTDDEAEDRPQFGIVRFHEGGGHDQQRHAGGRRAAPDSDVAEFEQITADEARGDSQPVTAEEFQRLARIGQEQLDEMKANSAPIDGLDDNWPDIQERAWTEAQKSWGGATIDARTGEFLPDGADRYALTVKDDGIETVFIPESASRAQFLDAMEQARTAFRPILERQNHFLGVFHDDDLNRIDIDPVTVVDTLDQVHTIGAATRAVGGAYNFADGNGYWPPHVADDLALAASAADGSMGEVTKFKGPGEWRRQAKQLEGAPDAPPQPTSTDDDDDEDEDRPQFAIVEFHEGGGHDQQSHAGGRRGAPDRADSTAVSTDTADGLVEAAARLEPEITATIANIVGDPDPATYDEPDAPGDADLYGYDFRLKAPDKVREKVGRQARDYGVSEDEAVGLIRDAVRYTVHTSPDRFGNTAQQLADELRKNHETVRLKNTWPDDDVPYKGVNIQAQRPDGLWFEVQVHTPQSQAVKNQMHLIYQQQRVLPKSDPRWQQFEQQMFDLSSSLEPPVGAEDVFRLVHPGRTVYNEGVSSTSAPTVWFRHLDVPDLRARWYWPNSTVTEVNTGDGWNEADILLDLLDDASWERIDPPASGSTEFANPWHDAAGRFAPKGTGRKSTGTGTADDPIVTDDVNVAAAALHDDLHVELTSEDVAATLIDELAARVRAARAAGEKAKPINLCNVSVTGSNLFCADSKGIPRVEMPQLKTFNPIPGSPADGMPRDEKGGVNLGPAFIEHMEAQGIPMVERTIPASHLKATQNELNGSTVAGMHEAIEAGTYTPSPIFSTSDRYVVDGHHRWAAAVAVGLGDAPDVDMTVREFDTDIITVLGMAREFTEMMGAPGASVSEGRFRSQMRLIRS